MTDQALIEAIRTGNTPDVFLLLAREADDVWLAHSPDDTATLGIARLGSTNVSVEATELRFHAHSDPQSARACQLHNRDMAVDQGWRLIDDPAPLIAAADVPPGTVDRGVPDALVEVNGRHAELYYV